LLTFSKVAIGAAAYEPLAKYAGRRRRRRRRALRVKPYTSVFDPRYVPKRCGRPHEIPSPVAVPSNRETGHSRDAALPVRPIGAVGVAVGAPSLPQIELAQQYEKAMRLNENPAKSSLKSM
jgi:hypothetical protein